MRMWRRAGIALGVMLLCCPFACALNPSLDINQYAHTGWTIRDGLFKSTVYAIAQTDDGYLWLGTEFGLVRFDGVRGIPWAPPSGEHLPSDFVNSLRAGRDGRLWIGTRNGLASWKEGRLRHYPELDGQMVAALFEDSEGVVWAGTYGVPAGRLCAIRNETVQCSGQDGSLGSYVNSILENNGQLWISATAGMWRWKPGPPNLDPVAAEANGNQNLVDDGNGNTLIARHDGIRRLENGKLEPYAIAGISPLLHPMHFLRDRDGGLWVGTGERGLYHVHNGRTDQFSQADGLSSDLVVYLFEDREGCIWVATQDGLERFRDFAVPTISVKQGLSNSTVWSVLAARDGSVWIGTRDGLNRWNNGKITTFRAEQGLPDTADSLFQDSAGRVWAFTLHGARYLQDGRFISAGPIPDGQVHSAAEDQAGNIWIGHDHGLIGLLADKQVEQIPWSELGRREGAILQIAAREQPGIWFGFRIDAGLAYFEDGKIRRSYDVKDGLGEGAVAGLQLDPDGALWAATDGGLSRVAKNTIRTLTMQNGLPCNAVHWAVQDDIGFFWLYTACGLIRIARSDLEAWIRNPRHTVQSTVFDSSDGVTLHPTSPSGYSPRVAKSADGKLWFVAGSGISVLDPRHLPLNKLPPPVHIEQITADHKTYWQNWTGEAASGVRLPALIRDLEIDYSALSLVAPEKIRFKYKLEGYDRDWQDAGNRRQAFYNNLSPRTYRFRVMASNNSGEWNEAGGAMLISIDPAYYQTLWFQASCVIGMLALLGALYRYRLRQIARDFNVRMEGRLSERTRIARELHDTLLQSFQGLVLRLQAVENMLPEGKAKEQMEQTLERADQAIAEGRNVVYDLRSSTTIMNELAEAVRTLGDELATEDGAVFSLVVEGASRDLHPIIRDELYRIAREALRNAFRHARAGRIETEITYGERMLRMRIRDDGEGIPAKILEEGRPGHFGLHGMRERAMQIGAKLSIWSGPRAGTEVELSLAGSIAYVSVTDRPPFRLFRKKAG